MSPAPQTFVNGDALRGLCDHIFWSNSSPRADSGFRHGQVVFCKIDEVWRLLAAARRKFGRIVVVTGEGDMPVDDSLWRHRPPQVAKWFATNLFVSSPDASALPLGLGNAGAKKTLSIEEIRAANSQPSERNSWLYANFSAHSNPAVRGPLLDWLDQPAQQWITRAGADSGKESYLLNLRRHRYILCPPGNGEDTHRFWEALYCGATPVIRRSPAMAPFASLGALVVDDFCQITREFLQSHAASSPERHIEMLGLEYWASKLDAARQQTATNPGLGSAEWLAAWWNEFVAIRSSRT